jgi:hypothetical protein
VRGFSAPRSPVGPMTSTRCGTRRRTYVTLPVKLKPSSFFTGAAAGCMALLEDDGEYLHQVIWKPVPNSPCGVWGALHHAKTELEMVAGEGLPLQIMQSQNFGLHAHVRTSSFSGWIWPPTASSTIELPEPTLSPVLSNLASMSLTGRNLSFASGMAMVQDSGF